MARSPRDSFNHGVARTLRARCDQRQVTYGDIARATGLSVDYLGRVLRGETGMGLSTAGKITAFLGLTLDELMAGTLPPPGPATSKVLQRVTRKLGGMSDAQLIAVEHALHALIALAGASVAVEDAA